MGFSCLHQGRGMMRFPVGAGLERQAPTGSLTGSNDTLNTAENRRW
jgi:hypothetical protein